MPRYRTLKLHPIRSGADYVDAKYLGSTADVDSVDRVRSGVDAVITRCRTCQTRLYLRCQHSASALVIAKPNRYNEAEYKWLDYGRSNALENHGVVRTIA